MRTAIRFAQESSNCTLNWCRCYLRRAYRDISCLLVKDIHPDYFANITIEVFEQCDADILYAAAMNDYSSAS